MLGLAILSAGPKLRRAEPTEAARQVDGDFRELSRFIAPEWTEGVPETIDEVRDRWEAGREDAFPLDPFDGFDYGYDVTDVGYRLWSRGPDGEGGTEDDIALEGPGAGSGSGETHYPGS